MTAAKIVLIGGEKDGLEMVVNLSACPDVFYAVPNLDDEKIKRTKSERARAELRERLSVLAYKFDPEKSSANRYRMYRCAELDRDPATA